MSHVFQVWAPAARESVVLDLPTSGASLPMAAEDGGWWRLEVADAGHGTDYAFRVDGGDPTPDPVSAWQPEGVHGPSRVFDPLRHVWGDGRWKGAQVLDGVLYELHLGTFTPEGTLDAAIERLEHLVMLGIDTVELLPVAAFPGDRGWGYDGVDLYAVHRAYGGPEALQRFVDACHQRGLAVCLDVVYNHLGPDGNYLSRFGPYFTDTHSTPWGQAVNLDAEGSDEVRRWIIGNALRWFEDFHVDALRLDAVHALVDESVPHLLAELSDATAAASQAYGRPLTLMAESDLNDPRSVDPTPSRGGDDGNWGMDAQWADDVHHALHALLTGERQAYYVDFGDTEVLARVLTEVFRHAGDFSTFRDQVWGRPVDRHRHRGHQFVVSLQNHDQIGNRAAGDRIGRSLPPGRVAAGAALLLTSPFTPMLFMGEEWDASTPWAFFTDFADPELAEAVRKGRRAEFAGHGWGTEDESHLVPDPQAASTRDDSVLRWEEIADPPHAVVLDWYRRLIQLRRTEPDLRADDLLEVEVAEGGDWVVVHRGSIAVLVNLAASPQVLPLEGTGVPLMTWGAVTNETGGWRLAADSVAIVRRDG